VGTFPNPVLLSSSPADGQVPAWDAASGEWVPRDSGTSASVPNTIYVAAPTGDAATDRAVILDAIAFAEATVTTDTGSPASGPGIPSAKPEVRLQPGVYMTDQTLVVGSLVDLCGAGSWASTIKAANGLNADVIQASGPKMWGTRIRNLVVDGNKTNQTAGHGVTWKAHGNFAPWLRGTHVVGAGIDVLESVLVINAHDDGFNIEAGVSELRVTRCVQSGAGRYGFGINSADLFFADCTSGGSGKAGFALLGGAAVNRFVNCKSYGVGNDGVYVGGSGFYVNAPRNSFVNCEAPECPFDGLEISAGGDGTEWRGRVTGVGGNAVTVSDNATDCDIDVIYADGDYGYTVTALVAVGTTGCVRNRIRARSVETPAYYTAGATGASALANTFDINNERGQQKVAYAAAVTPDPYLGGTLDIGTLTAAITINDPSTGASTDAKAHVGSRLTFLFRQDGTGGHAITWGSEFVVLADLPTTANAVYSITFEWDGTSWMEVAASGATVTGGGGGGSSTLGRTFYNGSLLSPTTTSGTSADIDATNLAVTFDAPTSGDVWFEADILIQTDVGDYVDFTVREGSSDVAGTQTRMAGGSSTAEHYFVHYKVLITGLTPGSTHTYKLGWLRAAGSGSVTAYAGSGVGPASLEVRAA